MAGTGATSERGPSLQEAAQEARSAWPGVHVSDEAFVAHLARVAPTFEPRTLRLSELFLAYACSAQDRAAIAHFEATYFDEVTAAVGRFRGLPVAADDVRQRVREKLFLAHPPALAAYAGRGELRGWLRAAVLHILLNISSRESRETPTDGQFFEAALGAESDPESLYLRAACREDFKEAFAAALQRLSSREKVLLRYAFADGLDVDGIGAIFGVHRATAARWIVKARERLVQETRIDLMTRLQVDELEAASIVRAALSKVGPTLLGFS